jgi:hypothetical protein
MFTVNSALYHFSCEIYLIKQKKCCLTRVTTNCIFNSDNTVVLHLRFMQNNVFTVSIEPIQFITVFCIIRNQPLVSLLTQHHKLLTKT